jgi:hypothetical protein
MAMHVCGHEASVMRLPVQYAGEQVVLNCAEYLYKR